jgi:transcriptional regulator with XRE-family HTH domain
MQKTIYAKAYRGLISELRNARRDLALRQEDVARKLHVSRHWVHKIETCAVRLDVLQMARLCQIYGIDAGRRMSRLAEELSDEDASLYPLEIVWEGCHCTPGGGRGMLCLESPRSTSTILPLALAAMGDHAWSWSAMDAHA